MLAASTLLPPPSFFFIIIISEPQVTNTASMRVLPADGLERGPGTAPFRAHKQSGNVSVHAAPQNTPTEKGTSVISNERAQIANPPTIYCPIRHFCGIITPFPQRKNKKKKKE